MYWLQVATNTDELRKEKKTEKNILFHNEPQLPGNI